jgi:carboxymethylenebutenolidase
VVLQEIFEVNPHIREICDGFVAEGYVSIALALYDRSSRRDCQLGYNADDITVGRGLREEYS